jgi:hypothetical protein
LTTLTACFSADPALSPLVALRRRFDIKTPTRLSRSGAARHPAGCSIESASAGPSNGGAPGLEPGSFSWPPPRATLRAAVSLTQNVERPGHRFQHPGPFPFGRCDSNALRGAEERRRPYGLGCGSSARPVSGPVLARPSTGRLASLGAARPVDRRACEGPYPGRWGRGMGVVRPS